MTIFRFPAENDDGQTAFTEPTLGSIVPYIIIGCVDYQCLLSQQYLNLVLYLFRFSFSA